VYFNHYISLNFKGNFGGFEGILVVLEVLRFYFIIIIIRGFDGILIILAIMRIFWSC
jgi:hypothetical protein